MPDTGTELGADLYELWRAGRDNLPTVARWYAKANGYVADTDNGLGTAFLRPAEFGGGAYGPVHDAWQSLRDEFQTILADTSRNLELVGDALCLAATEYAKADDAASAELDRLKKVNGDPPLLTVPPPQYPTRPAGQAKERGSE